MPLDSEQQETVLQLIKRMSWMAGWLRNPNRRGSDNVRYDDGQGSPPGRVSGMWDQRRVSAPTSISTTVGPHPMIANAEIFEPAPTTPNAELIPVAPSTANAQTVPPVLQTPAPAREPHITTSPQTPASEAPDTHEAPTAVGESPKLRQSAIHEAPGLLATDSLFCGPSFTLSLPV